MKTLEFYELTASIVHAVILWWILKLLLTQNQEKTQTKKQTKLKKHLKTKNLKSLKPKN